jgi:hypothetical protein
MWWFVWIIVRVLFDWIFFIFDQNLLEKKKGFGWL